MSGKRSLFIMRCCSKVNIDRKQLKIYFSLFMSMFGSAFSITMLFPFLPFMVQFLLPDIDPSSVGKYAGMIASAMFLGRFFGSYAWGALSDSLGYKPVLVVSSLLLGVVSMVFGLSVNFPMAVATRFILGLVNGIVGNTKAAMSANCNDKNQALGMSILASSYGVGIVVGPAISGAIADPIGQYNLNITNSGIRNLLTRYPYSLPCFVNMLVCVISALCILTLLPGQRKQVEKSSTSIKLLSMSQPSDNQKEDDSINDDETALLEDDTAIANHGTEYNGEITSTDTATAEKAFNCTNDSDREQTVKSKRKTSFVLSIIEGRRESVTLQYVKTPRSLVNKLRNSFHSSIPEVDSEEEMSVDSEGDEDHLSSGRRKERMCSKTWWNTKVTKTKKSIVVSLKNFKFLVCDSVARRTVLIYCIFSFAIIGFDEIYSIWCATPAYLGGIGFSLNQIGTSLSIVGTLLLPFTLTIYPLLERAFGTLKSLVYGLCAMLFAFIILPNVHYLVALNQPIALWVCLCFIMFLIRVSVAVGLACTGVLINNSVTFNRLGTINGLALMLTSAFRFFSPLFAGSVFSASLSKTNRSIGFPLDYNLIFVIFGVICLITIVIVTTLPESINRQKVSAENPSSDSGPAQQV